VLYLYRARGLLGDIRADANKDWSGEYKTLLEQRAQVETLEPQPPDRALLGACQKEVRAEIRPASVGRPGAASRNSRSSPTTGERALDKLRVLFLAASPIDVPRVDADQEFARIRDALAHHPNLTIEVRSALTFARLRKALQEFSPHVLHITSHGTPGQLYFHRDDGGDYQAVPTTTFARLLRALAKDLQLVVLNACHSLEIAEALVAEDPPITPWAIGMKTAIVDDDAIVFSNALYDSLAAGVAVGGAHEAALAGLELVEHPNPKLAKPPDIPRLVPDNPARAAQKILVRRG